VSRISWKQIAAALEAIEDGGSPEGVFARAVEQLNHLVPSDHGVAVPNMNLQEIRQRVGRPNSRMFTLNAPPGYWDNYVEYYEALDPRQYKDYYMAHSGVVTVDHVSLYKTEFGHDFLRKYGVRYCLCLSNLAQNAGTGFLLSLYRGGKKSFAETEIEAASALFPHIQKLARLATGGAALSASRAREAAAAAGLTVREQEVAVLLSERMSIREIADRLFISRHTAAKHMQHIYWKLNADGRSDVRRLLVGDQPG
jgi:DNA-binding CsgD family transcriptional regulator